MTRAWERLNLARGSVGEKCAFLERRGESLISKHGGVGVAWSGSKGTQGQALACSRSMAQVVKAMCVCVCMSSSTKEAFH